MVAGVVVSGRVGGRVEVGCVRCVGGNVWSWVVVGAGGGWAISLHLPACVPHYDTPPPPTSPITHLPIHNHHHLTTSPHHHHISTPLPLPPPPPPRQTTIRNIPPLAHAQHHHPFTTHYYSAPHRTHHPTDRIPFDTRDSHRCHHASHPARPHPVDFKGVVRGATLDNPQFHWARCPGKLRRLSNRVF